MNTIRILWVILLLSACLSAKVSADDTSLNELIARIERVRLERDIPAVALVLADNTQMLRSAVLGTADRASGRAADIDTVFRIGSVTKMFTALAVLMASEDGRLRLDAPVTDIVPDIPLQNPWRAAHPVRVEHLLEHTAGLADLSREEFDVQEPMALRAALAWKADARRCLWPPGMHHSYTNAGPGLAALVLEQATGRGYESFVEDRIFRPLEMKSAGFFPDERTVQALATGYDGDGHFVIPYWHMLYRAFGAINVRPVEMAPFIQLLLAKGVYRGRRLVSAAGIERMETPSTTLAARGGLRYGYGLGSYAWLHRGVLFHGHGGDADGYLSRLGYSRERGLGYFVVINVFRKRDLDRIQRIIEEYIATGIDVPEPPVHGPGAHLLSRYAGEYQAATSRFQDMDERAQGTASIRVAGTTLIIERDGSSRSLIPVNDRHFRYQGETVATSAFVMDGGSLYFQDESGNYVKVDGGRW